MFLLKIALTIIRIFQEGMQFGIKINVIHGMMQQAGSDKPIPRTRSGILLAFCSVFSFVFHPLLMTLATALLAYSLMPATFSPLSSQKFAMWTKELFLYTVILPLVSIVLFRLSGLISNARMHRARDRSLPLIATMVFYILSYWFFTYKHHAPLVLCSVLLGSCSAIIIIFIINIFYKVSVHTTAAAIPPGFLFALAINNQGIVFLQLLTAVFVALFVGVIRWLLGAHTIGQIMLGYTIGILMQLTAYFYVNS